MGRAPQKKVTEAVQVVCNETITVLLSIQIFNFVSEMYYFLARKFQSLLALKKVHIMSFKSDAIAATQLGAGFVVLRC